MFSWIAKLKLIVPILLRLRGVDWVQFIGLCKTGSWQSRVAAACLVAILVCLGVLSACGVDVSGLWEPVLCAFTAYGLWAMRQDKVTSEQAGAVTLPAGMVDIDGNKAMLLGMPPPTGIPVFPSYTNWESKCQGEQNYAPTGVPPAPFPEIHLPNAAEKRDDINEKLRELKR
jgi:hypothetical protein